MTTERTEQRQAEPTASPAADGSGPGGIGTGVAFTWAFAVQILIDAVFFALGVGPGALLAGKPLGARLAVTLLSMAVAAAVFTQGEALRRGRRLAWIIQIVANALLTLGGLVVAPGAVISLRGGHLWGNIGGLLVSVVLLIVSPLIVWLLTRTRTRVWIASVSSAEARARHGGTWLLWIALWAIIGGAAVAFSGYY